MARRNVIGAASETLLNVKKTPLEMTWVRSYLSPPRATLSVAPVSDVFEL